MAGKKIKILIVDDSDLIRHTLSKFFEEYAVEVVNCLDGLDGIKKALEHVPNLIFLDLMMPNFDGIKMLQVIKIIDTLKNIPVIVISGNTNKANVLTAIEAGADRVIPKPLQKEFIIKNVNEVLGENFLNNSRRIEITEQENREILSRLLKIFCDHYPIKKRKIEKSLETKNRELLHSLVHELKGEGGTIGYPVISIACSEIEKALEIPITDWDYLKNKCEHIFSIVEKIVPKDSYGENSKIIV
jgi:DNA-binding response OmpR family regulator